MTAKPTQNVVDLDAPKPSLANEHVVERVPGVEGEISALASANAPFIFFDVVSFCSINAGIAGVTLTASRQIANAPGPRVCSDKVIVAHLRASLSDMLGLRDTINALEKMAHEQVEAAVAAAQAAAPGGRPH